MLHSDTQDRKIGQTHTAGSSVTCHIVLYYYSGSTLPEFVIVEQSMRAGHCYSCSFCLPHRCNIYTMEFCSNSCKINSLFAWHCHGFTQVDTLFFGPPTYASAHTASFPKRSTSLFGNVLQMINRSAGGYKSTGAYNHSLLWPDLHPTCSSPATRK